MGPSAAQRDAVERPEIDALILTRGDTPAVLADSDPGDRHELFITTEDGRSVSLRTPEGQERQALPQGHKTGIAYFNFGTFTPPKVADRIDWLLRAFSRNESLDYIAAQYKAEFNVAIDVKEQTEVGDFFFLKNVIDSLAYNLDPNGRTNLMIVTEKEHQMILDARNNPNSPNGRKFRFISEALDYARRQVILIGQSRFQNSLYTPDAAGMHRLADGTMVTTEQLGRTLIYWLPLQELHFEKKQGDVLSVEDYVMGQDGPPEVEPGQPIPLLRFSGRVNDQVGALIVNVAGLIFVGLGLWLLAPLLAPLGAILGSKWLLGAVMWQLGHITARWAINQWNLRPANLKPNKVGSRYFVDDLYDQDNSIFGFKPNLYLRNRMKDGVPVRDTQGRNVQLFATNPEGVQYFHTMDNKNRLGDNPDNPEYANDPALINVIRKLVWVATNQYNWAGVIIPRTKVVTERAKRTLFTLTNDFASNHGVFYAHALQLIRGRGNFTGKALVNLSRHYNTGDARNMPSKWWTVLAFTFAGIAVGGLVGHFVFPAYFMIILSSGQLIGMFTGLLLSGKSAGSFGQVTVKELSHDYKEGDTSGAVFVDNAAITEPSTPTFFEMESRSFVRWAQGDLLRVYDIFQPGIPFAARWMSMVAVLGYINPIIFGFWIVKRFFFDPSMSGMANMYSIGVPRVTEFLMTSFVMPQLWVGVVIGVLVALLIVGYMRRSAADAEHLSGRKALNVFQRLKMPAFLSVTLLVLGFLFPAWGPLTLVLAAVIGGSFLAALILELLGIAPRMNGAVFLGLVTASILGSLAIAKAFFPLFIVLPFPAVGLMFVGVLFVVIVFPVLFGSIQGQTWGKIMLLYKGTTTGLADIFLHIKRNFWENPWKLFMMGAQNFDRSWHLPLGTVIGNVIQWSSKVAIVAGVPALMWFVAKTGAGIIGAKMAAFSVYSPWGILGSLGNLIAAHPVIAALVVGYLSIRYIVKFSRMIFIVMRDQQLPWATSFGTGKMGEKNLLRSYMFYSPAFVAALLAIASGILFHSNLWTFIFGITFLWSWSFAAWHIWLDQFKLPSDYPAVEEGLTLKRIVMFLGHLGKNIRKDVTAGGELRLADFKSMLTVEYWMKLSNALFNIGFYMGIGLMLAAGGILIAYGIATGALYFWFALPAIFVIPALTGFLFAAPVFLTLMPFRHIGEFLQNYIGSEISSRNQMLAPSTWLYSMIYKFSKKFPNVAKKLAHVFGVENIEKLPAPMAVVPVDRMGNSVDRNTIIGKLLRVTRNHAEMETEFGVMIASTERNRRYHDALMEMLERIRTETAGGGLTGVLTRENVEPQAFIATIEDVQNTLRSEVRSPEQNEKVFQKAMKDLKPQMLDFFRDWDEDLPFIKSSVARRVAAARTLGEIGDPRAVPALSEALHSKYVTSVHGGISVAEGAALALAKIKDSSAVTALNSFLKTIIKNESVNRHIFSAVLRAMAEIKGPSFASELTKLLSHSSLDFRVSAARILQEFHWEPVSSPDTILFHMAIGIEGAVNGNSMAANVGWGQVVADGAEAIPFLLELFSQNVAVSAVVRRYAAEAFLKINEPELASLRRFFQWVVDHYQGGIYRSLSVEEIQFIKDSLLQGRAIGVDYREEVERGETFRVGGVEGGYDGYRVVSPALLDWSLRANDLKSQGMVVPVSAKTMEGRAEVRTPVAVTPAAAQTQTKGVAARLKALKDKWSNRAEVRESKAAILAELEGLSIELQKMLVHAKQQGAGREILEKILELQHDVDAYKAFLAFDTTTPASAARTTIAMSSGVLLTLPGGAVIPKLLTKGMTFNGSDGKEWRVTEVWPDGSVSYEVVPRTIEMKNGIVLRLPDNAEIPGKLALGMKFNGSDGNVWAVSAIHSVTGEESFRIVSTIPVAGKKPGERSEVRTPVVDPDVIRLITKAHALNATPADMQALAQKLRVNISAINQETARAAAASIRGAQAPSAILASLAPLGLFDWQKIAVIRGEAWRMGPGENQFATFGDHQGTIFQGFEALRSGNKNFFNGRVLPGESLGQTSLNDVIARFAALSMQERFLLALAVVFHDYGRIISTGPLHPLLARDLVRAILGKMGLDQETVELIVALTSRELEYGALPFGEPVPSKVTEGLSPEMVPVFLKLMSFIYVLDVAAVGKGKLTTAQLTNTAFLQDEENLNQLQYNWARVRTAAFYEPRGGIVLDLSQTPDMANVPEDLLAEMAANAGFRNFMETVSFQRIINIFREMVRQGKPENVTKLLYVLFRLQQLGKFDFIGMSTDLKPYAVRLNQGLDAITFNSLKNAEFNLTGGNLTVKAAGKDILRLDVQTEQATKAVVSVPLGEGAGRIPGTEEQKGRAELRDDEIARALAAATGAFTMGKEVMLQTEVLNPSAARAEARMTAKIMAMMAEFGLASSGDQTRFIVPYNQALIQSLISQKPKATIIIMVQNDGTAKANAESGILGFSEATGVEFRIVVDASMDVERVARTEALAMWPNIDLVSGKKDPSIFQVTGAANVTAEQLRTAAALLGRMGGILGIAGFSRQKVSFATERSFTDIIQAEARAAASIAQSA